MMISKTNISFEEALQSLYKGKKIACNNWSDDLFLYVDNGSIMISDGRESWFWNPKIEQLQAYWNEVS